MSVPGTQDLAAAIVEDLVFWKQRWLEGQTGWHLQQPHPALVRFFPRLQLEGGNHVFVPLCGRSMDMAWLAAQGLHVLGCEISSYALELFFEEQNLVPEKSKSGSMICWQAGPYTLYEGNYFDLQPAQVSSVKAVYDRASLIALSGEGPLSRGAYVAKMRELFPPGTRTLLITMEYDQRELGGPPYSVGYEEVISRYAHDHIIEFLSREDVLDSESGLRERGLTSLAEWVFMLTLHEPAYASFSD